MKINNQNPTRSLERILHQEFGNGTFLMSEGAGVILVPGAADQIQISQLGNKLQILVNGSEKFLLTETESKKFDIRGDLKNINIDPTVSLYSNKTISSVSQPAFPGLVTERGEQLGHARRMESSFETAVTRGMITEDIKEDPFITHIGKQLQRLLGEMGAATSQQTAFRSEKDLVPFLTQFELSQGKGAISADLKLTAQNIQKQINAGGPIELEFLASQLTGAMNKANSGITTQAGRIPFEQHEIPLGESYRGAFEKWGMINDAINNNDLEKIAAFAGDPSILELAVPKEKSAFLQILAGAEHIDRQGIIQILQSATNRQEFGNIMDMAGAEKIRSLFKGNPAEFDLTADVFQSGELVSHFLQGFSPQQIFAARGDSPFENPLLLAITSLQEKAAMIQGLQSGYVSAADDRSIINILQSALNKGEFDQIVNAAGGKSIGLGLHDPVALMQWNRLAGAYDRMDLTTDFVEGIKYSNALLEPFPFDMNEAISFAPLIAGSILRGQSIGDVFGILDTFMKDASDWINVQMNVFNRGSLVQAGLENLNRMMGELPLLNIPGMRGELHSILLKSSRSQDILNYLQNLTSTFGLSEFDLRNLISQPLALAFQTAATEAMMLLQNANAFFQENIQLNAFRYGPESAQVRSLKAQIERAQASFLPFAERLQSVSNLLSEVFPAPVDFITSFSKFAAELNKKSSPVLANLFPSTAEVLNQLFEKSQTVGRLTNKQFEVTALTNNNAQLRLRLENVVQGFESLRNGALAREFSRLNQELARATDIPRELVQLTKDAAAFLTSIQDGSYAKTLNEVVGIFKKYDDPVADLTRTTAEQGAAFLAQLNNGSFSSAYNEFIKAFDNFQNNPGTLKLNQFFEKLSALADGIINQPGNVTDEAARIISDIAGGEVPGTFANLVKTATQFKQSPVFRKLIDLLEGGGKFLNALSSGNLQQNMEMMNSRFGYSPAIAQVIERGQHLTSTGTNVVKSLVARDFERPIAQITKKSQAKTQAAKDIPDVETIFSQAASTFYALTDVDHMDILWQYHRQLDLLNDKTLSSGIRQFEKQAQLLAKDPDLKNSLRSQFKTLSSLR